MTEQVIQKCYGASCSHLNNVASNMQVLRAAAAVEYIKAHRAQVMKGDAIDHNVICAHCFRTGTIEASGQHKDREFLYHALEHNHTVFVRIDEPYELFCMNCGDYSYSNLFDYLIKRARSSGVGGMFLSLEEKIVTQMGRRGVYLKLFLYFNDLNGVFLSA
jgi:hypothetical protein